VPSAIPSQTAPHSIAATTNTSASTASHPTSERIDILQPLQMAVAPTSATKPQGNANTPSPVVYLPMSPVTVVNNVPVQFLQLPLSTQPIVVTIPIEGGSTPVYKSHPRPLTLATRMTRRVGSTYLLQNQRVDEQRADIELAMAVRRANSGSTLTTFHHRPNILKNSARNNIKVSVKRNASGSLSGAEHTKHIRLNDVNGFILHADVSESAEAPLHNNSVHEKVTFLNMK